MQSQGLEEPTTTEYISQFEMLAELYAPGFRADTDFPAAMDLCPSPAHFGNEEGFVRIQAIQVQGEMEGSSSDAIGQSQAKADRYNDEACDLYDEVAGSLQMTGWPGC